MRRLFLLRHILDSIVLVFVSAFIRPVIAAPPRVCAHAIVALPSVEAHRSWLERSPRYGPEEAKAFADRLRQVGREILSWQIVVQEQPGLSAWLDLEGCSGLREAKWLQQLKRSAKGDDDYPIAVLVGSRNGSSA